MLDIDIQTPDLPGQMEPILGELKQIRESNALLKKRHTEIEAELSLAARLQPVEGPNGSATKGALSRSYHEAWFGTTS